MDITIQAPRPKVGSDGLTPILIISFTDNSTDSQVYKFHQGEWIKSDHLQYGHTNQISSDGSFIIVGNREKYDSDGSIPASIKAYKSENLEISPIVIKKTSDQNNGQATAFIQGDKNVGDKLSILVNQDDPEGTGELNFAKYSWFSSSNNISGWMPILNTSGKDLNVSTSLNDKWIKGVASYIDNKGFEETINTTPIKIFNLDDTIVESKGEITLSKTTKFWIY